MGHLGPVQARYDVLPLPALTADDVAAAGRQPPAVSAARQRPGREPSTAPSTAPPNEPSNRSAATPPD